MADQLAVVEGSLPAIGRTRYVRSDSFEPVNAGLATQALGLARDALAFGGRALSDRGDPGDDPARLFAVLYGDLLPRGLISQEDADTLARASELARAFAAGQDREIPSALLASVLEQAGNFLTRAGDQLARLS